MAIVLTAGRNIGLCAIIRPFFRVFGGLFDYPFCELIRI